MMMRAISRRTALQGAGIGAASLALRRAGAQDALPESMLVTNPTADAITFLWGDDMEQVAVAPSPWGLAVGAGGRAYVASAQFLNVVDLASRSVVEQVAYQTPIADLGYGEYRSGGMGIAVTPDGATVAVGIHLQGSNGVVELFDVEMGAFTATVAVGVRPFDVVASPGGRTVHSIDHDSFSITAIDVETATGMTIDAAPLGYGEFDKPHYAAVRSDGVLALPYAGKLLWLLDPVRGESSSFPMSANTHQHGIALSADESTAYIAGTGPAGPEPGPPSLTILNMETSNEQIIELAYPHEQVALSNDGKTAVLTGGYTFADGGWDGITRIDLETGEVASSPMAGRPLAIRRFGG